MKLTICWALIKSLRHAWVCVLAGILCGCSGLPAERAITVKLSPQGADQPHRSLNPLQLNELDELLEVTDATLLRHGLECTFKEAQRDSSKWKYDAFGTACVTRYDSHHDMNGRAYFHRRKEEVRIGLFQFGGWSVGSKEFRAAYSELATNVVEKFGANRVKLHRLYL